MATIALNWMSHNSKEILISLKEFIFLCRNLYLINNHIASIAILRPSHDTLDAKIKFIN